MSLKDRLNAPQIEKQAPVKYYQTSEEYHEISSLGVLDELLNDEEISSIYVNGAKNIYVTKKGKTQKSSKSFRDNVQLENIIKKNAQECGFEINCSAPYFEFSKKIGVNICATLPPLSSPATIYLKYYKDKFATLLNLQEEQAISKEIALFLESLFLKPVNVLITGEKYALKTTLLSALAKKAPQNERAVLIDYSQEFEIEKSNFVNYDFSNVKNTNYKNIVNSIVSSNPDNIFVNDADIEALSYYNQEMLDGYKGMFLTLSAKNPKDGMEKLAYSLISKNSSLNFETARILAYQTIDFVIHTSIDEQGRRKIVSISEARMDFDNIYSLIDIFSLNPYSIHRSCGVVPYIYKEFADDININQNIFEENYNHTYVKNFCEPQADVNQRGVNIDILKKFKKDLPTNTNDSEEIIKNAQNKFDELRKNAKSQEYTEENEDLTVDSGENL